MAGLKAKGDLAELMVATDLVRRGYRIAIPYGEDSDFDLILCRDDGRLERVQVKYTESDGWSIDVRMPLSVAYKREGPSDKAVHGRNDRLDRRL